MKILVLDDMDTRHEIFKKIVTESDELTLVKTAAETIEQLKNQTWDMVFLDHDLGGQTFVESGEETGYQVAEWLSQNPDYKPKMIFIHSMNPVGTQQMKLVLPEARIVPFTLLMYTGCAD